MADVTSRTIVVMEGQGDATLWLTWGGMDSGSFINRDQLGMLAKTVRATYDRLARNVVAEIKAFPDEARMSGDDSVLQSVWEEFKFQVQREHSTSFEVYEQSVTAICEGMVDELQPEQLHLLWLWSDGYLKWKDSDGMAPCEGRMADDVAQQLYDCVCELADTEELENDPDEPRRQEAMELEAAYMRSCTRRDGNPPDQMDCSCIQEDAQQALAAVEKLTLTHSIVSESHFRAYILCCNDCQRLFLHLFMEAIDWDAGDDSQAFLWAPVSGPEAERLIKAGEEEVEGTAMQLPERRLLAHIWPRGSVKSTFWLNGPIAIFPHD